MPDKQDIAIKNLRVVVDETAKNAAKGAALGSTLGPLGLAAGAKLGAIWGVHKACEKIFYWY